VPDVPSAGTAARLARSCGPPRRLARRGGTGRAQGARGDPPGASCRRVGWGTGTAADS
jgi:hypothetical protein